MTLQLTAKKKENGCVKIPLKMKLMGLNLSVEVLNTNHTRLGSDSRSQSNATNIVQKLWSAEDPRVLTAFLPYRSP